MITIVEPKEPIDRLWGKQEVQEKEVYRIMRYVLRVNYDGKSLLHNVVTGRLVLLNEEEASAIDRVPITYSLTIKPLIKEHFLVVENYDEHQQVKNLRMILKKLYDAHDLKSIVHYTILPTTSCNARCYYCFENGIKPASMTRKNIEDLLDYIEFHCDSNRFIRISWFGGEPTIAAQSISYICEGLQHRGIGYESDITTNGYLFDEKMVKQAKHLWHLKKAMICVDGTEKDYNAIKAFINPLDNPYQRVMRNIGYLLDNNVYVNLRMNFDLNNHFEFEDLVEEVKMRFGQSPYLQVRVHPVVGEYPDYTGKILHGSEEWFTEKVVELGNISREAGYMNYHATELPYMNYKGCQACDGRSVTVTPQGYIVRCPEQIGEEQITGTLVDGVTDTSLVESWRVIADYPNCIQCEMKPYCFTLERCSTKGYCTYSKELKNGVKNTMRFFYKEFLKAKKEDSENEF